MFKVYLLKLRMSQVQGENRESIQTPMVPVPFPFPVAELVKELIEVSERCITHKRNLTRILIEKISDEDKLSKLRMEILKYNSQPYHVWDTSTVTKVSQSMIQAKANPSSDEQLRNLEFEIQLLKIFYEKIKPYYDLYEKISDIIRDENMTPAKKIDSISNLFI